jgi:hypothetical protein
VQAMDWILCADFESIMDVSGRLIKGPLERSILIDLRLSEIEKSNQILLRQLHVR